MSQFAVVFNRRFVGGYLEGVSQWDRVTFPTWEAADQYRAFCKAHEKAPYQSAFGICPFVFDESFVEAA